MGSTPTFRKPSRTGRGARSLPKGGDACRGGESAARDRVPGRGRFRPSREPVAQPDPERSGSDVEGVGFSWEPGHEAHRRLSLCPGLLRRAPRRLTEPGILPSQTSDAPGGSCPIDQGRVFAGNGPRLRESTSLGASSRSERQRSPLAPRFGSQRDGRPLHDGHRREGFG